MRTNPGVDKGNTFGRPIGLGATPSPQAAADVLGCGFTQVPVIEYVTWTVNLPLTDAQIASTFGNEIDVLQSSKSVIGVDAVDSSFIVNSILQVNMFAIGYGVHFFGEPQSFTQIGNALSPMSAAPTATPVSPDVFTLNDVQVLGLATGSTLAPSILEWGYATWEALWHMANGYQFQWLMNQRHLLVNELAADTCYFGPYAEAVAAGTSEVSVQQFARQANNRYRNQGGTTEFIPVNARRIGSVNGVGGVRPAGTAGNVGLFHPTRDFDLAPLTHGGLRNQGGLACCAPFRKLIKPVLLEQGIPIGMKLVAQDAVHQAQMQRYMSISEGQTGTFANVLLDANDTGTSAATNGAAIGAMPELTLDQGANAFSFQQVTTGRIYMKGGLMKVAILIKGFEVWGAWRNFIVNSADLAQYVSTGLARGGQDGSMAGLPQMSK